MKFDVYPVDGKPFILDNKTLLEQIFMASMDKDREEERRPNNELARDFAAILASSKSLTSMRLIDIILMSFNTGYYFAKFMNKNEVKISELEEIKDGS